MILLAIGVVMVAIGFYRIVFTVVEPLNTA